MANRRDLEMETEASWLRNHETGGNEQPVSGSFKMATKMGEYLGYIYIYVYIYILKYIYIYNILTIMYIYIFIIHSRYIQIYIT